MENIKQFITEKLKVSNKTERIRFTSDNIAIYVELINTAIYNKGYYAAEKEISYAPGYFTIMIMPKGKKISWKNMVGYLDTPDYIDFGANNTVKKLLEPIILQAIN